MLRYKLLQRGEIFREEDVSLINGVAKIFNPNTGVTTEFTLERCPDHFYRFELFFNKGQYSMAFEVAMGVEVTEKWGMEFW